MNVYADIRNLGKWLNEEQTAPIDRQALARLLAWAQMNDKPAAWVYPEFFEGITKAGCWTAYAGDGSAAADHVERLPLYRGPLAVGDERRHVICLCPDCTKPAHAQEPVAWAERWYGSGPERGWWIVCGRDHIAHLGPSEFAQEAVGKIVAAHNRTSPQAREPLEPVEGDLLPAIGSKVLIHLARQDEWVEHTVAGYYVWGDLDGRENRRHRVFVRVFSADGILNARMLCDVRPVEAAHGIKEQS